MASGKRLKVGFRLSKFRAGRSADRMDSHPVTLITLIGFGMGTVVGAILFVMQG